MKRELRVIHKEVIELLDQLDLSYDSFDVDVNIGEEMFCQMENDFISFDIKYYNKKHNAQFKRELKKWNKQNGYNLNGIHLATFGLLHEIGHLIAAWGYDDIMEVFEHDDNIQLQYNYNMPLDLYKKLKTETDADTNAYRLFQEHKDEIIAFDKKVRKLAKQAMKGVV